MRYLLFGGKECYYAKGGGHDFLGCGKELDSLRESEVIKHGNGIEWWHIFDTVERKIVAGSKWQAYGADDLEDGEE